MADEIKDGMFFDEEGNPINNEQQEEKAQPPKTEGATEDNGEEDKSLSEEGHEDEEAHDEETPEEAEARRERNRQRRSENKQRRKDYVESLKREIAARDEMLQQAMSRLDAVEKRTQGADMAAVDAELKKSVDAYNYFKQTHAQAVTAADGAAAAEAMEKMMAAAERARQLASVKNAAQRRPQQAEQPLDPRVKMHAEDWLSRNSWYDPAGNDPDSQIALTIDRTMHQQGFNPTTSQYWEELDARLKKYLPHRYISSNNSTRQQKPPKSPVAGSGRETGGNKEVGYHLSADRVQAIKDAGKWDDPKERAAMIARYKEYDKQHSA